MIIRKAEKDDVPFIVQLLANDKLGKDREEYREPLPDFYNTAYQNIIADTNQELIVVENEQLEIIGTMQISFIQYLTYKGGIRAQIEAVRIHEEERGKGTGKKMIEWALDRAKQRGAHVVQLTTDKSRPEAIAFYEKLGFKTTHEGMKFHF